MTKLYGSVTNRLMEGKTTDNITEGMDITMFYWSDRHCYWVTKVVDQKHIFVKEYQVCADHSKPGGQGHQNWLYFKTREAEALYLKKYFPDTELNVTEPGEHEWVFRYGKWKSVSRWTKESIEKYAKENGCEPWFDEKEQAQLDSKDEVVRYHDLQPVSFGVRDYYHDWSF